jgi:2-hydroxy-3-keto-5-methylthiopentenyl-1-phosphate phosphatase
MAERRPGAPAPAVPPLRPGEVPLSILVDYDGTIALTDVSDTINAEHIPAEKFAHLEGLYETGRMGSRELMSQEIELFEVEPEAIVATAAAQPHDEAFGDFARRALGAGIPMEIVSDGFGFFIGPAMARLGLPDVPITTARTTFEGRHGRIEYPNGHPECFVCGTCKRNRVLAHRASGRAVVFIGDGESDRYAAGYSDLVFAKRALVAICAGSGWPYRAWSSFAEIDEWLATALDGWARDRTPPVTPRAVEFFCGPEVWGPGHWRPPDRMMFEQAPGGEAAPIGEARERVESGQPPQPEA